MFRISMNSSLRNRKLSFLQQTIAENKTQNVDDEIGKKDVKIQETLKKRMKKIEELIEKKLYVKEDKNRNHHEFFLKLIALKNFKNQIRKNIEVAGQTFFKFEVKKNR